MKTIPYDTTTTEHDSSIQRPFKVCMHLANTARLDFRVMRDAKALVEAGYAVTIVDIEKDHSRPDTEEIDGVCLKHMVIPIWSARARFKPWFLVKFLVLFFTGLRHLLQVDADIYHAHVEKALPACYLAARLRKKPLIFDAPDLTLSDPVVMRWSRLRKFSLHLLARMVSRCNVVITASPGYVPVLREIYRAERVTVIRNVPVYRVVPPSDRLRQHLGLGPEVRIALYQGYIQPNRGLDRLVRAAKFLDENIVIVLMGQAIEPTGSQLAALIASEGVAERVKILPHMPYAELLEWTASADIGLTIFPPDYSLSIRFTLPNKLFEYFMVGLPVLSAQLDVIVDVLKTYDVGQVAPSLVPEDLAASINAMLADTAALARMHKNALEVARQEFHWEKDAQKLVQLYHDLLAK